MSTRVDTAQLPEELSEERRRETLAALEDVDAGRVVEHDDVEAWAQGLGGARKSRSRVKRAG